MVLAVATQASAKQTPNFLKRPHPMDAAGPGGALFLSYGICGRPIESVGCTTNTWPWGARFTPVGPREWPECENSIRGTEAAKNPLFFPTGNAGIDPAPPFHQPPAARPHQNDGGRPIVFREKTADALENPACAAPIPVKTMGGGIRRSRGGEPRGEWPGRPVAVA